MAPPPWQRPREVARQLDRATGDDHTKGRLPTIPEGTHEAEPSDEKYSSVGSYLQHIDRDMQEALNEVSDLLELSLAEELKRETRDELDDRFPLLLRTANIDEVTLAEPSDEIDASFVELAVYSPMTNTFRVIFQGSQSQVKSCCFR